VRKLLSSILSLATLISLSAGSSAAVEARCEIAHDLVWLKAVAANGQRLSVILDSGAGCTVIDSHTASQLGLTLGGTLGVQGVDSGVSAREAHNLTASLAGLPLPSDVLTLDLASLSATCGRRVDGIVGLDFFRQHVVQISYSTGCVRFFAPGERFIRGESLALVPRNDALCVSMQVNGRSGLFRLDTGCSSALQLAGRVDGQRMEKGTSVGVDAGEMLYVSSEVRLGGNRLTNVRTGVHRDAIFQGESGLLGNGLLKKFTVTIDAASQRVSLAGPEISLQSVRRTIVHATPFLRSVE